MVKALSPLGLFSARDLRLNPIGAIEPLFKLPPYLYRGSTFKIFKLFEVSRRIRWTPDRHCRNEAPITAFINSAFVQIQEACNQVFMGGNPLLFHKLRACHLIFQFAANHKFVPFAFMDDNEIQRQVVCP